MNGSYLECSRPNHGSLRASSLGWRWPWSLVKSLHSGDPHVPDVLAAGRYLADALQLLFGLHPRAVHLCSCMFIHVTHALGGAMSWTFSVVPRSYVDVLNSHCSSNDSSLEFLPSTVAWLRFRLPDEPCHSQDLYSLGWRWPCWSSLIISRYVSSVLGNVCNSCSLTIQNPYCLQRKNW